MFGILTRYVFLFQVCLLSAAAPAAAGSEKAEHPLDPVIRIVSRSLSRIEKIPAYEALFTKKELVGDQMISQQMRMKFRRRPFSVYLYFLGDNEGREVIYVEGRNNGMMLAHETGLAGLVGTLQLAPTDAMVMAENRHPITEIGIENMLIAVLGQLKEATRYEESEVRYYKNARVGSMTCNVIEISHPRPRAQFPMKMTRLFIDKKTKLAVRLQQFGFPARQGDDPPLVEDYRFTEIRTDVRLTDRDFDPANPAYNF